MSTYSHDSSVELAALRRIALVGLVGLLALGRSADSTAAEPRAVVSGASSGGAFVGWNEVHAAVVQGVAAAPGKISVDRLGPALPPPPRDAANASRMRVQPSSLAGISSSVVPAVTGDLYWSRPVLDMRIIGHSIGQNPALRLSKPSVGVPVGAPSVKPASVGITN